MALVLAAPLTIVVAVLFSYNLRGFAAGLSGDGVLRIVVGTEREGLFDPQQREVFVWDGSSTKEVWLTLPPGDYFLVTDTVRCFVRGDIHIARGEVTNWVFTPITGRMPADAKQTCFPRP
jgi:hypothetical protein